MSERRRARAKAVAPGADADDNPRHIKRQSFDHPFYGRVILTFKGGKITQAMWTQSNGATNYMQRHWHPQDFPKLLQRMGIDD